MAFAFSPTKADVERYTRLRAVSRELNRKMVKTVPREAMLEVGAANRNPVARHARL